jgi:hypothetical protein
MIHPDKFPRLISIPAILILALLLFGCPNPEGEENGEGEGTSFLEMINEGLEDMPSSLTGTVYVNGRVQAFGTIQVYDEEDHLVAQERANLYGHFRIVDLRAQTYYLVYLNASGSALGEPVMVQLRPGRPEVFDLEITFE